MNPHVKYVIEGELTSLEGDNFGAEDVTVRAFVKGMEVACASVDKQSRYQLAFLGEEQPPVTELRVQPTRFAHDGDHTPTLKKLVSPQRYMVVERENRAHAHYDLRIPHDYLVLMKTISKTYQMQGAVYATTFVGGLPIAIEPLPAAKIEFYEVDIPYVWPVGTTPVPTEAYLGYAYSGPDGSYSFDFDFGYRLGTFWLFTDKVPDIRARVSQFVDGTWKQVYEGPVDWNIVETFHRDYFIPVEDIFPTPAEGVKPEEGFRFTSLGLLPIDDNHLVKGYAYAQAGDPGRIAPIHHQPLCGSLRLFGLFAEAPPVTSYKVQVAVANENGPTGSWQDATDPLVNQKWNGILHRWEPVVLGPDPVTGRYQNIDTQDEADWHEHALKMTWASYNVPNGYYALRIMGYDATDTLVGTFEMPVIRVDNDRPQVNLEVIGTSMGAVTECGALKLGVDRRIQFKATAYDPEGHVLKFWLGGTRGKQAFAAGPSLSDDRSTHGAGDVWTGIKEQLVEFTVDPLPATLAGCPAMAYNLEMQVWGLATDGYDPNPSSQWDRREVNLVVTE
ncbi:MAG: hypothetical protein AB1791_16430 [Chloroflexota bacterium]